MKVEVTNRRRKQSKTTREVSYVNKNPVILQHQALLHIISLQVSTCLMDCAFSIPSVAGPRFLPCLSCLIFNRPTVS